MKITFIILRKGVIHKEAICAILNEETRSMIHTLSREICTTDQRGLKISCSLIDSHGRSTVQESSKFISITSRVADLSFKRCHRFNSNLAKYRSRVRYPGNVSTWKLFKFRTKKNSNKLWLLFVLKLKQSQNTLTDSRNSTHTKTNQYPIITKIPNTGEKYVTSTTNIKC